jgi:CSLREA domain-containing protein
MGRKTPKRTLLRRCIAVAIGGAVMAAAVPAAEAATFTVTRTDDPTPNGCAPGDCSLREAVIAANAAGTHEIRLTSGSTYTLSIPGDANPTDGDLNASGSMRIVATGALPASIDGNSGVTGNRVMAVGGLANVTLENIAIGGGKALLGGDNVARGGGVLVGAGGSFTMLGGEIGGNSATRDAPQNGLGGGIYSAGTTTLDNVLIDNNSANGTGALGGGVYVAGGTTTITNSSLRSNSGLFGGALAGDGGTTNVLNTTISRNNAGAVGGALFAINGPEFNLHNVNVDRNRAGDSAGGIRARDATVRLRNTTVTANEAPVAGGISVQDDTGGDDGSIRLANSLIAGNTGGGSPDCLDQTGGQVTSSGYNLIGDMGAGGCSLLAQPGDQFGNTGPGVPTIDARLDSPKPNGGPPVYDRGGNPELFITNGLLPGSPAINAGAPAAVQTPVPCGATDARGVPRSLGGRCDTGAYELVKCQRAVVNRVGTDGADGSKAPNLQPTDNRDGYLGLGGNDKFRGGGGKDGLCGGAGKDKLRGDAGGDRLEGGPGRDVCIGGPGKDKARGCEVTRSIP